MKISSSSVFRFSRFWLPTAIVWAGLGSNPASAQTSPGQSGQFNRIGSVMTVAEAYTPGAASQLGSAENLVVDMNNNLAAANVAMQNSGTGIWVENVGYLETTETDPGTLHALLGQFSTWSDVANFWSSTGAGIIQCVGIGTDDAGLSYECGSEGTMSAVYFSANVYAHELGRNNCCEQGDGYGGNGLVTLMLFNYCSGNNLLYFSNPGAYYNGVQLLGSTSEDCGEGPLANEGNNTRQFTLNGPNYQGSKPVSVSSLNIYNPLLTAVHCGGAAVATQSADQRTFAADQNYSEGTAWDANGYNYTVDVSGVTNPAPQTVYQDQRYGNMTYTFNNYLPGTNYLVRLHFAECCWSASGQREFNVLINGQQVLTNFDVFATAGAENRAVIKEIMSTANASGQIVVSFVNVVDNAEINAIEILQGGLYVPLNPSATALNSSQVWLNWNSVTSATGYNVKRSTVSGGPYTTIASAAATSYIDTNATAGTAYYYVISALNGGNESFNSLEASATIPAAVPTDTWVGGSGNNFSPAANWAFSSGSGPVASGDALVFGGVGSTTPNNDLTGYTYSSLNFNAAAQAYAIGGNAFTLGTTTAGTVVLLNSTNSQTINNSLTLANAAQTFLTIGGNVTLGGSLTAVNDLDKTGIGALIFSGANSCSLSNLNVAEGIMVVTNSKTVRVGSASALQVGNTSGQSAALYQSSGTVTVSDVGGGAFQLGSTAGAAGYYSLTDGTVNIGGEFDPGGSGGGSGTFGQFDMSGGTVNLPNITGSYFLPNRGTSGEASVVNISGGTVQVSGGGTPSDITFNGLSIDWGAGSQVNATTISGTGQFLTPSLTVKLNEGTAFNAAGSAGNITALNLNGGVLQTLGFLNGVAANNTGVNINFNGGTLKAGFASNAAFMTNLAGVYIYGGGATINDNGQTITIGQALLTPSGNGLSSIAVSGGGSGYVVPPQVTISGGGGSGATAYATITGGVVTGITVTSPGNNYSSSPTVTLSGGGYTTAAMAGAVSIVVNTSGGLTKLGAGTLTLNQATTYTSGTMIGNGTLALSGNGLLASSSITVSNGATWNVSGATPTYSLASGQSLFGSGTVAGALIAETGSRIYAGTDGGYGTNTFNNNLTFAAGALACLDIGTVHNGSNDLITVAGTLALNNAVIHLKAPAAGITLDTNADYVLMSAGSLSGVPSAIPAWDVTPANATNYYVVVTGNTVALHYSTTGLTPPGGDGVASPTVVTRNQSVFISVTQTNGSTTVTNVSLNANSIGGPSSVSLVQSNSSVVFTNTVTVGAGTSPGVESLVVTLTDANNLSAGISISLTIVATNQVWDGGSGTDNNWTSNPNWISGDGPGYAGDSVTFAGSTRLSPSLNTNYNVTGLSFSNTAGSFTIGNANNSALTLSGGVINNSVNPQTLNVPISLNTAQPINAAAGNLSFSQSIANNGNLLTVTGSSNTIISSVVSGTGGLTKVGPGTSTLSGVNTYTGPTTVSAGTLSIAATGAVVNTNFTAVGAAAANAVLSVSGSLSQMGLFVGNASGAVGAVYQTGGTVSAATATAFDNTSIGNVGGAFGYYDITSGTFTSDGLAVGGENNNGSGFSGTGGNGIMDINGGTVNDTGWLVMARGATNETGIVNVYGGLLKYAGGGLAGGWGSGQTVVVNVLGGTVSNTAAVGINLNESGTATNAGVLNLNGGKAESYSVSGTSGQVNFNGGTLLASSSNPSFMTGLGSINVYGGGATLNDNGYSIGVNQALLAPAGKGVSGATLTSGGAGYIAPPIVTVVRGSGDTTGAGATASAQVDLSTGHATSGQVTNVLITSPGVNYTATPKFILSGGGAITPASITGQAPVANSAGGFTKTGAGAVTLGGYSTYTGSTTISNGTLKLADPVLHLTFDNESGSTIVNEGSGGSAMNGTLTGSAAIVSGGRFGNCLSIPSGAANAAYVLVNSPVVALTGGSTWTVAMWVKTTTAGGVYAYQGSGSWASGNMTFYLNEGSDSGYGTRAGGVSYAQGWEEGSTAINNGNWHFLVMTCNGTTKAMYVDGNADAIASSWAASTGVGSQFWIGGSPDTGDEDIGLGGLIDEVYVYGSALTPAQVQSLYNHNSTGAPVLPASTAVSVSGGSTLDINGLSQTIGSLTGMGNVILGDDAAAVGTFTVGNASNFEFDGGISDTGNESVTKAGSGTLILGGTSTYRGATTVTNGTLLVNGLMGSGTVTVANGATLGGAGVVGGIVTVQSGGTLSPGAAIGAIGTLTLSNSPALNGVTLLKVNRNNGAFLNDQIKLLVNPVNYGGNLTVSNVGVALQSGDTFQLFSAPSYGGSFVVTNLPTLNSGLAWSNSLAVNGQLAVASTVSLVPTNIICSESGTNLNLSWPADHTGWRLLMNTNGLVNPNWMIVANSAATNQIWLPIDPSQTAVFYQLVYP